MKAGVKVEVDPPPERKADPTWLASNMSDNSISARRWHETLVISASDNMR
jgi:hypothetical protein